MMASNLITLALSVAVWTAVQVFASDGLQLPYIATYSHDKQLLGQITPGGHYLDTMFDNYVRAQDMLAGNFTKKSKYAVVYMCYERADIIRQSFSALLTSEGLGDYDLFVSQDGGSDYVLDVPVPANVNYVYIRHAHNLCTGMHHYFVKACAFDIFAYEGLIVVEEDNVVHPQALTMLRTMLASSVGDSSIGLVSITDMDNSLLVDENRFSAGYQRAEIDQGHLWVYAMHTSRYAAVANNLRDYFNIIKGHDYRQKDQPPLRDDIMALMQRKGFPPNLPLSQDAFFLNSLLKAGFMQRFTSMIRLYEPIGWQGLHFKWDPAVFYSVYGRGMFKGNLTETAFEVSNNPALLLQLEQDCRERLNLLYQHYLGRGADQRAANAAVMRMLKAKLNAVQLMHNVVNSVEFRRRMKTYVYQARSQVSQSAT